MNKKQNKKLRSLIDCRNHWSLLWITGSDDKCDYPPARTWKDNCAVCDAAPRISKSKNTSDCKLCALTGYAWDHTSRNCFCMFSINSFYRAWLRGNSEEGRSFWASRMVWACNKAIEDILLGKSDE